MEVMKFLWILTKDLLENNFKSERDKEASALTIMDNKDSTSIVSSLISMGNKADVLTTVSALLQPILVENGRVRNFQSHHLSLCEEEVCHKIWLPDCKKTRIGKWKQWGKCSKCGRNTRYYCSTCVPSGNRRHYWCCSDYQFSSKRLCHTEHKKNIST